MLIRNFLIISTSFITCFFISLYCPAQKGSNIRVDIIVGNHERNFSDGFKLLFVANGKEIYPLVYLNGFVVPDFGEATHVDVYFLYKNKRFSFSNRYLTEFNTPYWRLNIDTLDGIEKGYSLSTLHDGKLRNVFIPLKITKEGKKIMKRSYKRAAQEKRLKESKKN
jgi:hypothetical protein